MADTEDSKEILSDEFFGSVRVEAQKFKALVKEMFGVHCETGLYTLRFHAVKHFMEDLDRFGSLELLNW